MSKILIVAPTRCYREALMQALQGARGLTAMTAVAAAGDVVAHVRESHPDVVMLDFPLWEAPSLIRAIKQVRPVTKVVALSVPDSGHDVIGWARAGATTCITRDTPLAELPSLIDGIVRGEQIGSPRVAGLLFRAHASAGRRCARPYRRALPHRPGDGGLAAGRAWSFEQGGGAGALDRLADRQGPSAAHFAKLGIRRRADAVAWLHVYQPANRTFQNRPQKRGPGRLQGQSATP
jgi:DNA-binding NarL/FixJ family response regulator